MASPDHVSARLLRLAADVDRFDVNRVHAVNVLSSIASELVGAGPIRLKLISTEPSLEEDADETAFLQKWVFSFPDGSSISTTTDVGWGDEPEPEAHGDTVLDVCGHPMTVTDILGYVISTGDGPMEDGDEFDLGEDWCSRMTGAD